MRELLSHTAGTGVSGVSGYAADKPVPSLAQVRDAAPGSVDLPFKRAH